MIAKLPGRVTIEEDVVFGTGGGRDLKCDIFHPPDDQTGRASLLILYGGAWRNGDRKQLKFYGIQLARFGYLCVCSEYRLSGESIWPAQIHDANSAVRWIRANQERLGIDPEKISVTGNSAGAHLALMVGATSHVKEFEGEGGNPDIASHCAGVIAIYPPTLLRVGDIGGAVNALLGDNASRTTQDGASPISYAREDFPPTMLIHGNSDTVVPVEASLRMYSALSDAGARVEMHVYEGAPHAFDALPEFGHQLVDLMALFIDRQVANPRPVSLATE
ncbi:MAG: alpha/beta hydrolase [Gammaproteobacteria bacterium]|nr:alpha/beta hydrolase [Gammaproteobacteria bacterium]